MSHCKHGKTVHVYCADCHVEKLQTENKQIETTEKQLNSIKWAVAEANKQLMLAEIAHEQNPNNTSHKQSIIEFKTIHEGLSEMLERLEKISIS
ncbi:hypothetical protein ACFYU8_17765 [Brevibacillus sp. NPDC003359]|uniref:hypothetical protein n=1 Tax=unclassified Brevibacillus TaxID=2684853 RepID=UPI00368254C2